MVMVMVMAMAMAMVIVMATQSTLVLAVGLVSDDFATTFPANFLKESRLVIS